MRFILTSALLLSIICFPVFSEEYSITKEVFSDELSGLAKLTVNSIPDNAEVYIDDVYVGMTDIILPLPADGPHHLEIVKPGYDNLSINFSANRKTGLTIDTILTHWSGTLIIKATPSDALITADGIPLSQGANELSSGSYTIVISRKGWITQVKTVRIFDDVNRTLSIELKPAELKAEASAPSEKMDPADYPFSSFYGLSTGIPLCARPGTLPPAGIQFITQFGFKDLVYPFSAGLRAVPVTNLEISAMFRSFISPGYIDETAVGASAAVKYSLKESNDSGFNAAAVIGGTFINTSADSPYNSLNSLAIAVPLEYVLSLGTLKTGLTLSTGLSGSFYLSSGTAVSSPAMQLLTPAEIWLKGSDFRIGISVNPEYPEFGYGFPGIQGITAAIEAGFRIPGTSTAISIFGNLDYEGIGGGAAVSFINF